jgi:hypothetical protein
VLYFSFSLSSFWVLYTMLPVSLGCQFLIAPSVFSIDYWACRSTDAVNVYVCCGAILCLYQGNPGFSSNQGDNSVIVNIFLIVLSISHIFFYPGYDFMHCSLRLILYGLLELTEMGIHFCICFYEFSIKFWICSDSVVYVVFSFHSNYDTSLVTHKKNNSHVLNVEAT